MPKSDTKTTDTVVLGAGNYYLPMSTNTLRYGVLVFVGFLIVTLLLLVTYGFYRQRKYTTSVVEVTRRSRIARPPPIINFTSMHGASSQEYRYRHPNDGTSFRDPISCNSNPTSTWLSGSCVCDDVYWGPSCDRQIYDDAYVEVGDPHPSMKLQCLMMGDTPDLIECTNECNKSSDCNGVIWDAGHCKTISTITVDGSTNFTFDPSKDSQIYMRDLDAIKYVDRVFIFQDKTMYRYYLSDRNRTEGYKHLTAMKGVTYSLDFYPTKVINQGKLTGRYWVDENNVKTVSYNQDLSLPPSWYNKTIYVQYH